MKEDPLSEKTLFKELYEGCFPRITNYGVFNFERVEATSYSEEYILVYKFYSK
jgi:hypothetical protein